MVVSQIFEINETRVKVAGTDQGRELIKQVRDLHLLLDAYRSGAVTENHVE